jgi:small basic protein
MDMNLDTLALLGLWMFAAIQLGKGKAWADKWTIYLSLGVPFVLAALPVWGGANAKLYVEYMAKIFLYGTNVWAIGKVTQGANPTPVAPSDKQGV